MDKKMIITTGILFIIIILGIFTYTLMSKNSFADKPEETEKDGENDKIKRKIGVIYFSATGTTKEIADYISQTTGGDLIEIVPEENYTSADLNYTDDDSRANKEQKSVNARPKIKNKLQIEEYDTIYLGYPIWWGMAPKIIYTLLDTYDFKDKEIIPFCTSGGSSIDASVEDLKELAKNAVWHDGKRFSKTSKDEIENWAIWK